MYQGSLARLTPGFKLPPLGPRPNPSPPGVVAWAFSANSRPNPNPIPHSLSRNYNIQSPYIPKTWYSGIGY
ncbi:hypothetical protein Hanom_Chr05g00390711 [Helianthus anomalus]